MSEGPEKDFKKLVVMIRRLAATKPLDKSLSSKLVSCFGSSSTKREL